MGKIDWFDLEQLKRLPDRLAQVMAVYSSITCVRTCVVTSLVPSMVLTEYPLTIRY